MPRGHAGGRSARNDVAGIEGHLRPVSDERSHAVDHLRRRAVLPQLAVDAQLDGELLGVGYLVGGNQVRPQGTGGIEVVAEYVVPARALGPLDVAGADVV